MKKIVTATIAALMTATPALADNSYNAHVELWDTLQSVGVTTHINPTDCESDFHGFYNRRQVRLVVCQDNSTAGGRQVDWTSNDLDTLRHEAQHVLQDCMVGGLGDGRSSTYFDYETLKEFISKSSLTESQLRNIINSYSSKGAPEDVIIMELEAFAVATDVDASSISGAIKKYCM